MPPIISRGFRGRRQDAPSGRVPPGQYVTMDFPVLSAGPTPHTPLEQWDFTIVGEVGEPRRWTWEEFRALPAEEVTADIHCVTKWSKLDSVWQGVRVDTLLQGIETSAGYTVAFSDGGYTTNVPLEDLTGGKAWGAFSYDGEPLEPQHGGPARMLVPHLYFWKSAKWVRGLRLTATDQPGFWEVNGYHKTARCCCAYRTNSHSRSASAEQSFGSRASARLAGVFMDGVALASATAGPAARATTTVRMLSSGIRLPPADGLPLRWLAGAGRCRGAAGRGARSRARPRCCCCE